MLNSPTATAEVVNARLDILPPVGNELYGEMSQIDITSSQTFNANVKTTATKAESGSCSSDSNGKCSCG